MIDTERQKLEAGAYWQIRMHHGGEGSNNSQERKKIIKLYITAHVTTAIQIDFLCTHM